MFKKFLFTTVLVVVSVAANAGEVEETKPTPIATGQQQQQQQQTNAESVSSASNGGQVNGGNTQMIIFTGPEKTITESTNKVEYSGTQTLKNVPTVNAPPLTTSNDTCMGSASGSANGPGFGVSFGKTYTDENCVMLKNSREFWNWGFKAAALARMCMDEKNRESLEITDFECPQTAKARQNENKKPNTSNSGDIEEPQLIDPVSRQRMGYKPLSVK